MARRKEWKQRVIPMGSGFVEGGRAVCALPIAASRTGLLGGTVAPVGFPDIGLQGLASRESDRRRVSGDMILRHLSLVTRHTSDGAGECQLRGQEPGGTACCRPQFQGRRHWCIEHRYVRAKIGSAKNIEDGGSGGARTRHKSNVHKAKTAAPSQIASQAFTELASIASAWTKLPVPLKAAILAIVNLSNEARPATGLAASAGKAPPRSNFPAAPPSAVENSQQSAEKNERKTYDNDTDSIQRSA